MKEKFVAATVILLLFAGPAYPQEKQILALQSDMFRLITQMNVLQTTLDERTAVLKSLVEKMADQVNTLTGNMQKITQAVDSVKSQTDKTSSESRTILNMLSRDMDEVQDGLSAVRSQVNSITQQLTTMRTTAEPLAGPDELMRTASLDVIGGSYDLALSGFKEFLTKYPNDPRAAGAQYGLGDVFFRQKKFDQAIVEFDLLLQKYPDSDKKRTALYYKGLAHAELNQIQKAIEVLESVAKQYPGTIEATSATAKIAQLRRGRG